MAFGIDDNRIRIKRTFYRQIISFSNLLYVLKGKCIRCMQQNELAGKELLGSLLFLFLQKKNAGKIVNTTVVL